MSCLDLRVFFPLSLILDGWEGSYIFLCYHLKETSRRFVDFPIWKYFFYKLITLGTKFKNLLSIGGKITMFSKFTINYIEQVWWHSSLSLKCMHLQLKEVNKRGSFRHAYILHGWTCVACGIVMEIHCRIHVTGSCEAAMSSLFSVICSWFSKVLLFLFITTINSSNLYATWLIYVPPKVKL